MIVLDTNVLSELMRKVPEPRVVDWLDARDAHSIAITAITVAEILYGIERLPDGKRKAALADNAASMVDEDFAGRVLPFDPEAAVHYAQHVAAAEKKGKKVHMADAQIAAICIRHQATLATRNVKDFAFPGMALINPWAQD